MRSLYDDLGVTPSADQDQLRRAFRQRARALHPDVNGDVDEDSAMRRLNAAWAVLGDPAARLRYDQQMRDAGPATTTSTPPPQPSGGGTPGAGFRADADAIPTGMGWFRLLRPSVIIPVVLFLIFVVTAFAGQPGSSGTAPAPKPTVPSGQQGPSGASAATDSVITVPARAFVGRCIRDQSGPVLLVPCSERPNSLVIAAVPASGACPSGSSGYLVAGQDEMVCADPTSR
ncbi:MAG: molecular chaperone DnaJ [Acidimicrobiaceae bacterium]|nr:molecular chaperone DnaJ [Acidimicrobiaceae bacterium]